MLVNGTSPPEVWVLPPRLERRDFPTPGSRSPPTLARTPSQGFLFYCLLKGTQSCAELPLTIYDDDWKWTDNNKYIWRDQALGAATGVTLF